MHSLWNIYQTASLLTKWPLTTFKTIDSICTCKILVPFQFHSNHINEKWNILLIQSNVRICKPKLQTLATGLKTIFAQK
jgi:hypothetical protein